MASEEERHNFVAQLLVGHAAAMLVVGFEEGAEKVGVVVRRTAARADEAVNHVVEVLHRSAQARAFWNRDAVGEDERQIRLSDKLFHDHCDRLAHAAGFSGNIRAEQRFGHDIERGRHKLLVDVSRFAVAPSGKHHRGGIRHNPRVVENIFVAKCRLDQFPLRLPKFSFTRQQAVAENGLQSAVVSRLKEIRVVFDENLLDTVGMHDEADRNVEEAKEDDVAVFAGAAREETAPVLAEGERVAQKIQAARAGREFSGWADCYLCFGHCADIIRCGSSGKQG